MTEIYENPTIVLMQLTLFWKEESYTNTYANAAKKGKAKIASLA